MSEYIDIPEEDITVVDEVIKPSIMPVIAGTVLGLGLAMVGAAFIMRKDQNNSPDDESDVIVTEDTINPEDN